MLKVGMCCGPAVDDEGRVLVVIVDLRLVVDVVSFLMAGEFGLAMVKSAAN